MKRITYIAVLITWTVGIFFISGCGETDFALEPTRATIDHITGAHNDLVSLPEPQEKIVIAVYKFRDQTGQYKTSESSTTFSTAVTQGAR